MPNSDPPQPRSRRPSFAPRFSISMLYLAFFFVVFSFLLVLPDLIAILGSGASGPAMEKAAEEATREGLQWRLALALSLAATGLGAHFSVLPGLRPR